MQTAVCLMHNKASNETQRAKLVKKGNFLILVSLKFFAANLKCSEMFWITRTKDSFIYELFLSETLSKSDAKMTKIADHFIAKSEKFCLDRLYSNIFQ